jgi:hypothetical protein
VTVGNIRWILLSIECYLPSRRHSQSLCSLCALRADSAAYRGLRRWKYTVWPGGLVRAIKHVFILRALVSLGASAKRLTPRLLLPVQSPQHRFRIDALANAVHVKGVIPAVPGEGSNRSVCSDSEHSSAVCGTDLQAAVIVRMKWAEIEPASSGWSDSIVSDQILYVVGLVVPGDDDSLVVPLGGDRPEI